ncbi:MAG: Gfo/Idh/MocA family protein [Alphaproteobacteria bacterium]
MYEFSKIEAGTRTANEGLRAAVVGAGYFGRIHAGKYASMADVELVTVVDPDLSRARAVAEEFGAEAAAHVSDILGRADVATVAAPAAAHYPTARTLLSAGIHTLVEKPIALDLSHADELIALAARRGCALQVGHQERYVIGQFGILDRDVTPSRIECRRAGPFTGRGLDTSVVMDLMIHDLDLVHQVAPAPVDRVRATGMALHGTLADEANAELVLQDGCAVHLHASRNAKERERSMKLVYPDGEVFIDFVKRTLTNTTGATLVAAFGGENVAGRPAVAGDPVGFGVRRFVDCVRDGETPWISGPCGRRALETALRITAAIGELGGEEAEAAPAARMA